MTDSNENDMSMSKLKIMYENMLRPIFGELFRIDESDEQEVLIILDGGVERFFFSLYGNDCVRLYWCNESFIFDKKRNLLVSSDTYGEIVFEEDFEIEQLPQMIVELILHLKDSVYVDKKEYVKGKTPWGYDDKKDYTIKAKTNIPGKDNYKLGNISIEYD